MPKGINRKAFKCFERIVEICNSGGPDGTRVSFTKDFGGAALTVSVGNGHHHTYPTVNSTEELIEYLYNNLQMEDEDDTRE